MKLRNDRSHAALQFIAYTNRGVQTDHINKLGKAVKVQEKPQYEIIFVPAQHTVIIDDELWNAVDTGKVKRKIYTTERTKIANLTQGKKQGIFKNTHTWTGEYKYICPIQELVDRGEMTIIERPKSTLTPEDMRTVVEATGMKLPKDSTKDYIEQMYELVRK
ncbi:MAG: hypothetical protein HRT61_00510 [Ekhidna sp.]|nr:hypothetical protein [Ekhidna sp.]